MGECTSNSNPHGRWAAWNWFECQSMRTKEIAVSRLLVVQHVEALCGLGWTKIAAIARVARENSAQMRVCPATIWNWLRLASVIRKRPPACAGTALAEQEVVR